MEEGLAGLSLNEEEDDILQVHVDPIIERGAAPLRVIKGSPWTFNNHLLFYIGSNGEKILYKSHCRLRHNDSFCEAKMELGVEVADMGWDSSLRAQSRMAAVMNSMWLKEEEDRETNDDGVNAFRNESNGWSNLNKIMRYKQPVDPILGFSLEGRKILGHHLGNNLMLKQAYTDMEHDLEERVLIGEEGKKRARGEIEGAIVLEKENSPTGRSRRLLEGNNFVSATTKRQADRVQ
ncbi:hypothetical protein CXB51_010148 [Gossypium anomalum]|uniref:Uncharacterized protein n=1 Tax=Gossypium anomalum TaxID=47600 RepID=A0A8J5YMI6_9ROSI|nr:hypothetical protein CXB51_010148 [Gossypium anomalum]